MKWEYKVLPGISAWSTAGLFAILTREGLNGWELVTIIQTTDWILVFKRPLEE